MKVDLTIQTSGRAPRGRGISVDEYSDIQEVVVRQSAERRKVKILNITANTRYNIGTRFVLNIKFHFNKSRWNVKELGHIFADTGFAEGADDFIKSFAKANKLPHLGAYLAGYREQGNDYVLMTLCVEGADAANKWINAVGAESV